MRLRITVALLFLSLIVAVVIVSKLSIKETSPEELLQLCNKSVSNCNWLSYQEDIKGGIGARSVAQWQGKPVEINQEGSVLTVVFSLSPPWSEYQAAIPVLIRDPMGRQYSQESVACKDALRKYQFNLDPTSAAACLPWIEIRYPHSERRIALDSKGKWQDISPQ